MICNGEDIVLTSEPELSTYQALTEFLPPRPLPATVSEMRSHLESAARYWEQPLEHGAGGSILASLARSFITLR